MSATRNWGGAVLAAAVWSLVGLLTSCTDAEAVNAAFRQSRVTWHVFDPKSSTGVRDLPGFDQEFNVDWFPRDRAVRASALETLGDGTGAAAVSFLGLVILTDREGSLVSFRPGFKASLAAYRTDGLFTWNHRLFVLLGQEPPGSAPPASLIWWEKGQARAVLYPLPSQVRDSSRQSVGASFDPEEASVTFFWKSFEGGRWSFDRTKLMLSDGSEAPSGEARQGAPEPTGPDWSLVRSKLAERLGLDVGTGSARGPGPALVFTETGWTSVADPQTGRVRLFRLPDLGIGGRYTGALALSRGWVFSWEVSARGYSGASGLVYVPRGILAP